MTSKLDVANSLGHRRVLREKGADEEGKNSLQSNLKNVRAYTLSGHFLLRPYAKQKHTGSAVRHVACLHGNVSRDILNHIFASHALNGYNGG